MFTDVAAPIGIIPYDPPNCTKHSKKHLDEFLVFLSQNCVSEVFAVRNDKSDFSVFLGTWELDSCAILSLLFLSSNDL